MNCWTRAVGDTGTQAAFSRGLGVGWQARDPVVVDDGGGGKVTTIGLIHGDAGGEVGAYSRSDPRGCLVGLIMSQQVV